MEIVENKEFYHVYRDVPWNPYPKWQIRQTYFIGRERNPFIKYYDRANCIYNESDSRTLINAISHYQKYVREQTFEEVRLEFFPNLPSRYKCLWVIEDDLDVLKYWWEDIFKRSGEIIRFVLDGKIHRGNEQYLQQTGMGLDFIRQQAFKYWTGARGSKPYEIVFEGFATVKEFVTF